ncbi:Predicted arabinose efflux permease, MFS family [Streptomyces sp. DvalAA-14]|uniref:MFS transporter n=1 Tax=unclassified Streptomyces TaxID=2593676 RepID=UPI00081B7E2B|nr:MULTISPECIES: MFS transporter [unclassified Streptomyces]MYS19785.1 MFS transporter [Streptomyces sp. SID4948]SCD53300.1 Predicted arabinose efflux permease, MFS family [Streptomyces sp. DvalAA-14]
MEHTLPSRAEVLPRVTRIGASGTTETSPPPSAASPAAAASPSSRSSAPSSRSSGPTLSPLGLLTVLLGAALPMVDFFIVNVALPTIDRDLNAGPAVLEMVVAGYGVAYAVLLVLGGRLGDMFGRRNLFLWGLAAFAVTSLACGISPNAWTLVGARVAQGAASALLLPQVLATIQSATSGGSRSKALSYYGATAGVSSVVGQVLGGVLVSADIAGSGWRAIFLVNVPIAALALVLALRSVPETRSPHPARIDRSGTVLLAVTLIALLLPLTEGRAAGWPLWSWVLLGLSPFGAAAFIAVERHGERTGGTPLLPPSLVRIHSVRSGLLLILPFCIGFGGFMFVVAVALQDGLHFGPLAAGGALVPLCAAFFVASLLGPRAVARYGRRTVTWGSAIQGAGVLALAATFGWGWPHLGIWALAPSMALAGFGQGFVLPVVIRIVLSEVPPAQAGVGGGAMATTQQASLALGVATLGTLFLTLSTSVGIRDALVWTLLAQLAAVAATIALSVRLPRALV